MATVALSGIITPSNVVTATSTATLTNKTISGASNTLTNIPLSTGVTGTLPIANGGTNSTATPTAGTVPYGTGTAFAFTSAGTSGQLLQSNGASAPTWVAPVVSLISSVNIANTSVHNFTGLSGKSSYQLLVMGVSSGSVTGSSITIQVGTGSAQTTDYYYGGVFTDGTTTGSTERDNTASYAPFIDCGNLSSGYTIQLTADFFTAPSQNPTFQFRGNGYGGGNNTQTTNVMGVNLALASMTSIHLDLGSTNFTGSIYLYGVSNA